MPVDGWKSCFALNELLVLNKVRQLPRTYSTTAVVKDQYFQDQSLHRLIISHFNVQQMDWQVSWFLLQRQSAILVGVLMFVTTSNQLKFKHDFGWHCGFLHKQTWPIVTSFCEWNQGDHWIMARWTWAHCNIRMSPCTWNTSKDVTPHLEWGLNRSMCLLEDLGSTIRSIFFAIRRNATGPELASKQ